MSGLHPEESHSPVAVRCRPAPAARPAATRPRGVLVVDDEAFIRTLLAAGLRQEGLAVWLAASGQEALDLYRRHRDAIDVALLDVRMPGADGVQTLTALRVLGPRILPCFMSGDLGNYTEEGLRDLGAATVFRKPFDVSEVARVLAELARPRG
jgi:CheY-like chemotaxis protein